MPKLILHEPRLFAWVAEEFSSRTPEEAAERITSLDALAETIVVDGQEHFIPSICYRTWAEMEEISPRPRGLGTDLGGG